MKKWQKKWHLLSVGFFCVVFLGVVFSRASSSPPKAYAATDQCTFDSGTKYPLGDTTNSTNKSFDANNTDFYDIQQNYYFVTLPTDDLSVNTKFFQDSQADGNGYDLYPKLASVVGFIPSKVLNAYHLKHKTKNTTSTGDDKPFTNAVVEVQTTPNQDIKVPVSGYNILYGFNPPKGQGNGPAGLLMWTNGTSFVFQIGRADNPRNVFIYVFDVCVDKSLVTAYNSANAAGRNQLPELQAGQVIAKATMDRVRLGVRDNGVFVEGRTPYVWDTNYQKSGTSSYPVSSPSLVSGSINTSLPAGVIKIGWPNPQDPPTTIVQSATVTSVPSATTVPSATPTPTLTPTPTPQPTGETQKTGPHIIFSVYKPTGYVDSNTCNLTDPYCIFDQVANRSEKQLRLCTTADTATCTITATLSKKTDQADGLTLFDFQADNNSVSLEEMNKVSCYKANISLFCFK